MTTPHDQLGVKTWHTWTCKATLIKPRHQIPLLPCHTWCVKMCYIMFYLPNHIANNHACFVFKIAKVTKKGKFERAPYVEFKLALPLKLFLLPPPWLPASIARVETTWHTVHGDGPVHQFWWDRGIIWRVYSILVMSMSHLSSDQIWGMNWDHLVQSHPVPLLSLKSNAPLGHQHSLRWQ